MKNPYSDARLLYHNPEAFGEHSDAGKKQPESLQNVPTNQRSEGLKKQIERANAERKDHNAEVASADEKVTKEQTMQETSSMIDGIIKREEANIHTIQKHKVTSGWFGKFNRLLTGSDPYAIDTDGGKKIIATMQFAKQLLEEAKTALTDKEQRELMNAARRMCGLSEVDANYQEIGGVTDMGVNRTVQDQGERYKTEQEAITVSRDVAVTAIVTGATLGTGTVLGAGAKGVQTVGAAVRGGATMGGTIAGMESGAKNIDDVQRGEKTIGEAAQATAIDTTKGAAGGGLFGGIFSAGGKLMKSGLEKFRPKNPEPTSAPLPEWVQKARTAEKIVQSKQAPSLGKIPNAPVERIKAPTLDDLVRESTAQTVKPLSQTPVPNPQAVILQKGEKVWLTEAHMNAKGSSLPRGQYTVVEQSGKPFIYDRNAKQLIEINDTLRMKLAPVQRAQAEAVQALQKNDGWKLHLNFDADNPQIRKEVDTVLGELKAKGIIPEYKIGHGGGAAAGAPGKEATVYVGNGKTAKDVARYLEERLGKSLKTPAGDTITDDVNLTDKVMGRFDLRGDSEFTQYGSRGVPYKFDSAFRTGAEIKADVAEAARKEADQILQKRYGDFYSGAL